MPKAKLFTIRRVVDVTPAVDRQLQRLAVHHERTIPDLIRQAISTAYGLPTVEDREPTLFGGKKRTPDKARYDTFGRKKAPPGGGPGGA